MRSYFPDVLVAIAGVKTLLIPPKNPAAESYIIVKNPGSDAFSVLSFALGFPLELEKFDYCKGVLGEPGSLEGNGGCGTSDWQKR